MINVSWDVPFARGLTGAAGALLDGWQLTGIWTMRSGQPLTVFVQNNRSRSQWSPSIAPEHRPGSARSSAGLGRRTAPSSAGPNQWFDPAAFVLQPAGTFGNTGRGAFRGPDLRTLDLALVKRAAVGRRGGTLEFRIEVFNLLNRANFGNPRRCAPSPAQADGRSAAGDASAASPTR